MTWTVLKLIQWTEEYFKKHNVPNPRLDAELLLSHLLKKKRIDLYLQFDAPLNQSELASFKELVKRRIAREPLQHITQTQEFWSLPIKVTPDVLIPRQETEHIIEHALKLFNKDSLIQILDIGTGSGAIAAALASEFQNAKITATDISEKALVVAKENLLQFGDQIILKKTNLFDDIQGNFDLVVSNPPYVSKNDLDSMQSEVGNYEPHLALFAGNDGLEIIKRIISGASRHLNPKGWLIMEFGYNQGGAILSLINEETDYTNSAIHKDYSGNDRILTTQRK